MVERYVFRGRREVGGSDCMSEASKIRVSRGVGGLVEWYLCCLNIRII